MIYTQGLLRTSHAGLKVLHATTFHPQNIFSRFWSLKLKQNTYLVLIPSGLVSVSRRVPSRLTFLDQPSDSVYIMKLLPSIHTDLERPCALCLPPHTWILHINPALTSPLMSTWASLHEHVLHTGDFPFMRRSLYTPPVPLSFTTANKLHPSSY